MSIRETTHEAGRAIKPTAKTLRARVFMFILAKGETGATLEEMEQALKMPGNTVRPRRVELEDRGLVQDSGRKRLTASGRSAIVWTVPPAVAARAKAKIAARASA